MKTLLKSNLILRAHLHENISNSLAEGIETHISRKGEPRILDQTPQDFDEIQFWRIRG